MEIEKQVCALEIAQKLKSLGVKQESLFYWVIAYQEDKREEAVPHVQYNCESLEHHHVNDGWYLTTWSAFTVAELGEMLPDWFDSERRKKGEWMCRCIVMEKNKQIGHWFFAKTEADARAKMLIYLIENKLVEL